MSYAPTTKKVLAYIKKQYGAEPEYLWARLPNAAALRHQNNRKWFAALMLGMQKKTIGLSGEEAVDILNIKCDPKLIGSLRDGKRILPGYHMSKEHWVSLLLDGSLPVPEICALIDTSYDLTRSKMKKAKQETTYSEE